MCCPHCHCEDLKKLKRVPRRRRVKKLKRKVCYDCRWCKERFKVRTGTVFQRSHIPLNEWPYAIFILETGRKRFSSPGHTSQPQVNAYAQLRDTASRSRRGVNYLPLRDSPSQPQKRLLHQKLMLR